MERAKYNRMQVDSTAAIGHKQTKLDRNFGCGTSGHRVSTPIIMHLAEKCTYL